MAVAAHRGDCYNYPENTMIAFGYAIKNGADMIETDVRLTSDNVLVIMHDEKADRTTDKKGLICDMTYDEVKKINAGYDGAYAGIPLFEDVIKLCMENHIMLNIEIKEYYSPENEERCIYCIEKCIELVEKYQMTNMVVLNSFDAFILEYVYNKYGKKYMLHGFFPYDIMKNVKLNPDEYLYCACIFDDKDKAKYDYLKSRNIEPWIGAGVTQQHRLKLCFEYGAKLVTTNNPKDAIEKLQRLGIRNER